MKRLTTQQQLDALTRLLMDMERVRLDPELLKEYQKKVKS